MAKSTLRLIIIESPFAGSTPSEELKHSLYLHECIRDSIFTRGEAPFASHKMYPGALNDKVPYERESGIAAGLAWGAIAERAAFYIDFGMSPGMHKALEFYKFSGTPIEYRNLPANTILDLLERLKVDA